MNNQHYTTNITDRIATISKDEWQACNDGHPFTDYNFLLALEESNSVGPMGTGWIPRYFQLMDSAGQMIACMPAYLKTHSQGEYVFDHNWAEAYMRAGGQYYPKLQASIPFTPATGPRLLVRKDIEISLANQCKQLLINAAKDYCKKEGLSSFHMTFLQDETKSLAENMGLLIRVDQQFHWHNDGFKTFDDFLATLASRKRKQIKKERRAANSYDLSIQQLSGHQMTPEHWRVFFDCYQDTGARKWGKPYLTQAFFTQIGSSLPDQIMVVFVQDGTGNPVACALNFIGKTAIYGRYWGALQHYDCLHFEACYYQAIDYAIKHDLDRVEAGAQGPHKVARGYRPSKTYSAHYLPDQSFHDAVQTFLRVEHQHVDAEIEYLSNMLPFKKGE